MKSRASLYLDVMNSLPLLAFLRSPDSISLTASEKDLSIANSGMRLLVATDRIPSSVDITRSGIIILVFPASEFIDAPGFGFNVRIRSMALLTLSLSILSPVMILCVCFMEKASNCDSMIFNASSFGWESGR